MQEEAWGAASAQRNAFWRLRMSLSEIRFHFNGISSLILLSAMVSATLSLFMVCVYGVAMCWSLVHIFPRHIPAKGQSIAELGKDVASFLSQVWLSNHWASKKDVNLSFTVMLTEI